MLQTRKQQASQSTDCGEEDIAGATDKGYTGVGSKSLVDWTNFSLQVLKGRKAIWLDLKFGQIY